MNIQTLSYTKDSLFPMAQPPEFPSTRYQGSKTKLVDIIWENTKDLKFKNVIDLFGGTGAVGYMYKLKGKQVFYNDYLKFNYITGLALIENSHTFLDESTVEAILNITNKSKNAFIVDNFRDIYYTDEENIWLDNVVSNIAEIKDKYKQALAFFALFQSCLVKRPYNLFHRKNLYVRMADVKRSFGNKATWDTPFPAHFKKFVKQGNQAIFDNGKINLSYNKNVFDLQIGADLVYIDTPYISKTGVGVDYIDFYHFLEGISDYSNWEKHIDRNSKHLKFKNMKSVWSDKSKITDAFDELFNKYQQSILVVSYRSDGIPTPDELIDMMKKYKRNVIEVFRGNYKYALSKNGSSHEILIIGS